MKKQLMKIAVLAISAVLFVTTGCNQQSHEHTYSADWSSDDTYHWHAAACEHTEEVSEKGKHKWNDGEITTEATCSAEGVKTYTCTVCGKTKTQTVDKLSHSWDDGEEVTAPTCGAAGKKKYKCSVCSTEKEESVPKLAHTWNDGVITKEAACTTTGIKTFTCTVCGQTKTEEIPAIGHNYEEEVTQQPTFYNHGWKKVWCNREGCPLYGVETSEKILPLYSIPVDCTTGQAATSASQYVYFGVFPQTIRDESVTVTEVENSPTRLIWHQNPDIYYYQGSDGEWYAKCLENAKSSTGDEYKYSNGVQAKQKSENSYEWFKIEPIKWKVLTTNYNGTGKALLLAEDILIAGIPYYTYDWQNGESANRTINGKTVYRNNYKYSIIRAYLNGKYETEDPQTSNTYKDKGFLQCAFLQSSQDLISVTDVDNSADSTTDAGNNKTKATKYACDNTSDKIFLLSEKEVTNTTYSFGASGTGRFPTDYAKANYAYQNDESGYGGYWRLRSPAADEDEYDMSDYAWYMDIGSTMADLVYGSEKGVVPALTISLTSE